MNEKTTLYLEPKLKEDVKIELIREGNNESMSALANKLFSEWLKKKKKSK